MEALATPHPRTPMNPIIEATKDLTRVFGSDAGPAVRALLDDDNPSPLQEFGIAIPEGLSWQTRVHQFVVQAWELAGESRS